MAFKSPASPRPLADLLDACLAPALAAQGFADRSIVALWPEIVGERLATRSRPLKIDWPRRRGAPGEPSEPATLVVRIESAFALDLQQLAPLVTERVNTHLGWRAIGRIVLKQGPVEAELPRKRPPLDPARQAEIEASLTGISDPDLRAALARLGAGLATRANNPGSGTKS